jgi:hypothetical protein
MKAYLVGTDIVLQEAITVTPIAETVLGASVLPRCAYVDGGKHSGQGSGGVR